MAHNGSTFHAARFVLPDLIVRGRDSHAVLEVYYNGARKTLSAATATITSYSMVDDGALCKVLIPFAGAGALAAGALTVDFRDRSFDLRAVSDGKVWRLHVPLLHEEINQHECGCRVRPGKLIVRLAKRDGSKGWYELRKTKGVGDTEWHKLVPDAGESVVVTI